ncbi:MAG: hypothetical protein K2O14_05440 [Oscillospiraceae bacterium]|nr:hypothetical protein [Oscillospiraceae bacterium]
MKKFTRIVSAALAAMTAAVLSVSAYANEFVYNFDDSTLEDGIEADTYDINGTEIMLEKELGDGETDPGMSVRTVLFNEYIDPEFWNDPDVTVSIDVRLDTEGANVIAYIIGFDSKWTWINPSDFTVLKYNEWITITETGAHFYEYFKTNEPNRLLFQTRSNWGAGGQGTVRVTARNFRISDGKTDVVLDPTVDASVPESTEPVESGETTAPAASSTPAPDTSAPESTPATSVTSIQTAAAASTSINYAEMMTSPDSEKSTAMVFIIIIAVAAVVVAGIVVGYLIYKKKKYY